MQRWLDWLGEYPTALTVLGGVGAAICGAGLAEAWGRTEMAAWGFGIALSVVLPTLGTRINRLQQGRLAARRCVKNALAACGAAYGHPSHHVRVNIMMFTGTGRRRVDSETAFNMEDDPDQDLEIDATAGVSGEAYVHNDTFYGDLELALEQTGPTWGLRANERARVRPTLKSILSVPIKNPDRPNGTPLGTLQVDSDLRLEAIGFDNPERRAVAERFADVIALLLATGR